MTGVPRHSAALVATLALAGSSAAPAAAMAATAKSRPPTQAQIRQAVKRLQRSRNLWATVDICNTRRHPRVLGVRGQMPSLGFGTTHEANIQVDYQPTPQIGYKPDPAAKASVPLGYSANKLLQGGATWQFPKHTGLLRATVTFVWRRGSRQIARIVRTTTGGHRDVKFGDPPRFSAAQCKVP
jgi:hypothetical protein